MVILWCDKISFVHYRRSCREVRPDPVKLPSISVLSWPRSCSLCAAESTAGWLCYRRFSRFWTSHGILLVSKRFSSGLQAVKYRLPCSFSCQILSFLYCNLRTGRCLSLLVSVRFILLLKQCRIHSLQSLSTTKKSRRNRYRQEKSLNLVATRSNLARFPAIYHQTIGRQAK